MEHRAGPCVGMESLRFQDSRLCLVSDSNQRLRQYAGLAVVVVAFVGGIVGWSWAAFSVDSDPSAPDTTHTRVESSPGADSAGTTPGGP